MGTQKIHQEASKRVAVIIRPLPNIGHPFGTEIEGQGGEVVSPRFVWLMMYPDYDVSGVLQQMWLCTHAQSISMRHEMNRTRRGDVPFYMPKQDTERLEPIRYIGAKGRTRSFSHRKDSVHWPVRQPCSLSDYSVTCRGGSDIESVDIRRLTK